MLSPTVVSVRRGVVTGDLNSILYTPQNFVHLLLVRFLCEAELKKLWFRVHAQKDLITDSETSLLRVPRMSFLDLQRYSCAVKRPVCFAICHVTT